MESSVSQHECHFQVQTRIDAEDADGLRWEVTYRIPTCECGREQPTQTGFPRPPTKRISVASSEDAPDDARELAKELWTWKGRRASSSMWETVTRKFPDVAPDMPRRPTLEALARAGAIRIERKWDATWQDHRLHYVADRLQEVAFPGRRASIRAATNEALQDLPDTEGARLLEAWFENGGPELHPDMITWARRVVDHGAAGETSLLRTFSARYSHSKEFELYQSTIEKNLGGLAEYGIQRPGDQLLLYGEGKLGAPHFQLQLSPNMGVLGLDRLTLQDVTRIDCQAACFVENKQAFYAITTGAVPAPEGLVIYMAGNPGKTVKNLVTAADAPVWVWADLDPYGVGFARRLMAQDAKVRAWNMETHWLESEHCQPLPQSHAAELERQLAAGGPLQPQLEAMQTRGVVMEQERQIDVFSEVSTTPS